VQDELTEPAGLVLIADDDPSFAEAFGDMLRLRGYETEYAGSSDDVVEAISNRQIDLLTLDLDWENREQTGIDILKLVQRIDPLLPVIMLTGHSSIPTAVEATRLGAYDYMEKMLDREKTAVVIKNAIEAGRLKRENRAFLTEIRCRYAIIGSSAVITTVHDQVSKVGPTDSVVLITGESGTGKELVARQVHYHSPRREKKFVSIDAGALVDDLADSELFGHKKGAFTGAHEDRKGLVEEAEGGTLFLDEISNAKPSLQAKLLHLLQEREYRRVGENTVRKCNVRLIAATNRSLPEMCDEGKFRSDLYYRLKVVEIALPPLRHRKEDISLLVDHFMKVKSRQCLGRERRLRPDAVNVLLDHDWPGNVRELENAIERLVILSSSDEVSPSELKAILGNMWKDKATSLKSLNEMTREFKRECIIKAINLAEGKIARAAEILQVDRTHLYKLINEFEIKNAH
jgi:DNA-binding NtrC family response regulator